MNNQNTTQQSKTKIKADWLFLTSISMLLISFTGFVLIFISWWFLIMAIIPVFPMIYLKRKSDLMKIKIKADKMDFLPVVADEHVDFKFEEKKVIHGHEALELFTQSITSRGTSEGSSGNEKDNIVLFTKKLNSTEEQASNNRFSEFLFRLDYNKEVILKTISDGWHLQYISESDNLLDHWSFRYKWNWAKGLNKEWIGQLGYYPNGDIADFIKEYEEANKTKHKETNNTEAQKPDKSSEATN